MLMLPCQPESGSRPLGRGRASARSSAGAQAIPKGSAELADAHHEKEDQRRGLVAEAQQERRSDADDAD